MNKHAELEKRANTVRQLLKDPDKFKTAFTKSGEEVIKTVVQEESIVSKVLNEVNVTVDSDHVYPRNGNRDGWYYRMAIEEDATAYVTDFRSENRPRFVDGKYMEIGIDKVETEEYKKPKDELEAAPHIYDMLKRNGANYIRRIQDSKLMDVLYTSASLGTWDNAHTFETDWSSGTDPFDMTTLSNIITKQELKSARFIMSETAKETLANLDNADIGNGSFTMFQEGMDGKNVRKKEIVSTIKGQLEIPSYLKLTGDGTVQNAVDADPLLTIYDDGSSDMATYLDAGLIQVGDIYEDANGNKGTIVDAGSTTAGRIIIHYSGSKPSGTATGWKIWSGNKAFDFTLPNGVNYTRIYCVTDKDYLGKFINKDGNTVWTDWVKELFHWQAWKKMGLGIGNAKGISVMNVQL